MAKAKSKSKVKLKVAKKKVAKVDPEAGRRSGSYVDRDNIHRTF